MLRCAHGWWPDEGSSCERLCLPRLGGSGFCCGFLVGDAPTSLGIIRRWAGTQRCSFPPREQRDQITSIIRATSLLPEIAALLLPLSDVAAVSTDPPTHTRSPPISPLLLPFRFLFFSLLFLPHCKAFEHGSAVRFFETTAFRPRSLRFLLSPRSDFIRHSGSDLSPPLTTLTTRQRSFSDACPDQVDGAGRCRCGGR